jgi:hypothetical protein
MEKLIDLGKYIEIGINKLENNFPDCGSYW